MKHINNNSSSVCGKTLFWVTLQQGFGQLILAAIAAALVAWAPAWLIAFATLAGLIAGHYTPQHIIGKLLEPFDKDPEAGLALIKALRSIPMGGAWFAAGLGAIALMLVYPAAVPLWACFNLIAAWSALMALMELEYQRENLEDAKRDADRRARRDKSQWDLLEQIFRDCSNAGRCD